MAQLVAKKYAIALFELAKEGDMDMIVDEAGVVLDMLLSNKEFLQTLLHPRISAAEKIDIMQKSFAGCSSTMQGFLDIVIRKNREAELVHMLEIFSEMVEEHKGVLNTVVLTASPLSDGQAAKIKAMIEKKTNKTVNMEIIEDSSLIGGICVKAGGFIFDSSVRKQLDDMRFALLAK